MANSTLGSVLELAGVVVLGYTGYRVVEGLVQQAEQSGQSLPQQVGQDVGNTINRALNALNSGLISLFKTILKQATITAIEIAGGWALVTQSGKVIGYVVKQGITWVFSKRPPSGGGTSGGAPVTPPAPAPNPQPTPNPTPTQPIGANPTPDQAQSLLARVESLLRSGRKVAVTDINNLITYHQRGLITGTALFGLAAILVLVQPELAPVVAAAAMA